MACLFGEIIILNFLSRDIMIKSGPTVKYDDGNLNNFLFKYQQFMLMNAYDFIERSS
jgi:hypothetical protein